MMVVYKCLELSYPIEYDILCLKANKMQLYTIFLCCSIQHNLLTYEFYMKNTLKLKLDKLHLLNIEYKNLRFMDTQNSYIESKNKKVLS